MIGMFDEMQRAKELEILVRLSLCCVSKELREYGVAKGG